MVLEKGEGVYLTDVEGKKYLDFGAGIAVFALGYHYQGYDEALKNQIDQLIHTSNLYYNVPLMTAGEQSPSQRSFQGIFHQQRNRGHRRSHQSSKKIRLEQGRLHRS